MVFRSKLSIIRRDAGVEANAGLYAHANTFMVGGGSIVLDSLDMVCKLYTYSSEYEPNIFPWSIMLHLMTNQMETLTY